MADIKVMPLKGLLAESFSYMRDNGREMTLFAVVHMMFLTAAFELIDGWHDVFFLPWLAAYYLFWCFFFRFYFKRRPYLATLKLFDTLVPSTKILALTFLVVTALLMLPLIPPFSASVPNGPRNTAFICSVTWKTAGRLTALRS